jgi:GNAT superfamily N-acetyltransferase
VDPDVRIRDATPDDAAACAAVHVASWQVAYRGMVPDDYLDALRPEHRLPTWEVALRAEVPAGRVLVAEVDGEVAGFGSYRPHPTLGAPWGLLPTLYLAPAAIGRGVGAALLAAVLEGLAAEGYEHVELWVHPGNHRARRFYERHGWTSDGTTQSEEVWGVELQELRMTIDLAG